jgi:site-specific DNA-methyltransferase (adenine-specific)
MSLKKDILYKEDNQIILKSLPDKCLDMILEDMPYNNTDLKFEYKVDLQAYWEERLRAIKDNGVIALTAQQPFVTDIINSNRKMFRYEIIWEKNKYMGFLNANKMPLRGHENILIFYKKLPTYNPQKVMATAMKVNNRIRKVSSRTSQHYTSYNAVDYNDDGSRFPHSVLKVPGSTGKDHFHPTQKPLSLFSWLIRTYTNPGELVFDGFAGAATTAVAAIANGRKFIACEWGDEYYDRAQERIKNALNGI